MIFYDYILTRYFDDLQIFKDNQIAILESEITTKNQSQYQLIVEPQMLKEHEYKQHQMYVITPKNQQNQCRNEIIVKELDKINAGIFYFEDTYISFQYDGIEFRQLDDYGNKTYTINYRIKITKEV